MKLEIILNMPVRDGALVHRVVVDHKAPTLDEFMRELADCGYVIVDEYYPDKITREYENYGPIAYNYTIVGKVKLWDGK